MEVSVKIAIVYYSRTGNTEFVVNAIRQNLIKNGFTVDVYKVLPVNEYSKPLHLNPRLLYDTLIRKGTDLRFLPNEPKLNDYDVVMVASPIWCYTLTPPIQEFLRRYCGVMRGLVIIVTSMMNVKCSRIKNVVKDLCKTEPISCINMTKSTIKDHKTLEEMIQDVTNVIINLCERIL